MDIESAFRKYRVKMEHHITAFCGDPFKAKDAVSWAFTKAWISHEMLTHMPEPAMKAWLYAAARNAAVDTIRRESRFTLVDEFEAVEDEAWEPTDSLVAEELLRLLPGELGVIVRMKYYRGMNSVQIGTALQLPPATVRTKLKKAISIMRKDYYGEEKG